MALGESLSFSFPEEMPGRCLLFVCFAVQKKFFAKTNMIKGYNLH